MGGMVGCVVVNWNGWRDTVDCLRSLRGQTHQQLHVFVVDNGSTDESLERIGAFVTENSSAENTVQFTLIPNGVNAGFGKGSNVGIRAALNAGCEYVWLLNNDTECPPDTLEKLLHTAYAQPDAGMVGTVLLYHHDPSQVQAWGGGHINRWTGTTRHFAAPTTFAAAGSYLTFASVLIHAEVLREIGLLYEGAFMYYEDADFSLRMEPTRWKIAMAADTAILHKEGASTDGVRNPFMEKTIAVSGFKFLRRHSPFYPLSMPLFLAIKLGNRARLGEWAAFGAVLRAVPEYLREGT